MTEYLQHVKADVVLAFFGYNESYAGPAGLEAFTKTLDDWIVHTLAQKYNGLPFTTRWLTRKLGSKALLGLADLRRAGMLNEYPPLPEKSGGLVAQFENTFLITKDGCKVLTRDDD